MRLGRSFQFWHWSFFWRSPVLIFRRPPKVWGCSADCHRKLYRLSDTGKCPRCGAGLARGSLLAEYWGRRGGPPRPPVGPGRRSNW